MNDREAEGGYAAVDFKAPRRCVYCWKRQATPDSLSCVECMRGALRVPLNPELLQNTLQGVTADLDALRARMKEVAVYMPDELRPPWWRRAWRWLRSLTGNAP